MTTKFCRFHQQPAGCRNGENCGFSHDAPKIEMKERECSDCKKSVLLAENQKRCKPCHNKFVAQMKDSGKRLAKCKTCGDRKWLDSNHKHCGPCRYQFATNMESLREKLNYCKNTGCEGIAPNDRDYCRDCYQEVKAERKAERKKEYDSLPEVTCTQCRKNKTKYRPAEYDDDDNVLVEKLGYPVCKECSDVNRQHVVTRCYDCDQIRSRCRCRSSFTDVAPPKSSGMRKHGPPDGIGFTN